MSDSDHNPPITVFMPVYNSEKYLNQSIESILFQTFKDFEFLIIDDHSTDGSLKIIYEYAAKDSRIKVVNHQTNQGIVNTANEAIVLAKGEFLARMDSDDISPPERLEKQYAFFKHNTGYVCVGSKCLLIDTQNDPLIEFPFFENHEEIMEAMLKGSNVVINPSLMIKLDALKKIGGYRQEYPSAEDFDCVMRLAEVGKLRNLPDVIFKYRQHLMSIGYMKREQQKNDFFHALEEAYKRRNLYFDQTHFKNLLSKEKSNHYQKWGWWALKARNVNTARKYALKSILKWPNSKESWKLLYCSLRGY